MADITYVVGDATDPHGEGMKVIAHVCNDIGRFGAGFALAVARRWPNVRDAYLDESRRGLMGLGEVLFCGQKRGRDVDICVANMVAQCGLRSASNPTPIRYDALRTCLLDVAKLARGGFASVHMPRIGCGLAGGSWDAVEPIIRETLIAAGVPVTVYDLPT